MTEEPLKLPSADAPEETSDDDAWVAPASFAADDRIARDRVLPSWSDPIVRAASSVVGGPIGRHAAIGRSRLWTPIRVLFLLTLCVLALGWFSKSACLQESPVRTADGATSEMRLNWDDQRQFTNLCYSDVIALYGAEHLDRGAFPYRTYWYEKGSDGQQQKRYMEYPVLTGLFMYGAAQLAQWWGDAHEKWGVPGAMDVVLFFNIVALGLALFWIVTIWATALSARTRVWLPWMAALSPLVIVHIFTNFDAIAIAMVALALLAWSREKPVLAGLAIGLGTAAKLYPALLLVVLAILCLRAGKVREFAATAVAAVLTWGLVNLPILMLYPAGWREFFRYNADRGADADSIYRVISDAAGFTWNHGTLNALSLGLLVVVIIGLVYIGIRAPQRPRVAQLAFLLVAGFLLVNKVWSPQYSLWLVPLAVLAIPHARLLFAWMVVDALVWIPRMALFLDDDRLWLPDGWFTFAIVLRALMVIALCGVVVWQIWNPREDLIRRGARGETLDDPAGGVLDGAPDRLTWSPRRPALAVGSPGTSAGEAQ